MRSVRQVVVVGNVAWQSLGGGLEVENDLVICPLSKLNSSHLEEEYKGEGGKRKGKRRRRGGRGKRMNNKRRGMERGMERGKNRRSRSRTGGVGRGKEDRGKRKERNRGKQTNVLWGN